VGSWTNTTPGAAPSGDRGILSPARTTELANVARDYPVSPRLAPFVERYWSVRWDLTGRAPYRSEVLAHPSVNVSIESGSHPRFGVPMPAALVHGVVTTLFAVDLVGWGRVTAVKFRPGGFTAFTGCRPGNDRISLLTDPAGSASSAGCHPPGPGGALGFDAEELTRAVLAEDDDGARAKVLDAALAPLATEPAPAYLELLEILAAMAEDRALVRAQDVAARAGMSVRSLQRLFAGYVGVSPKAVLARYRLQNAAASIDAGEVDDLAGLAASLGWFDQAHFSREFRAVVGVPPGEYLRGARDGRGA
jgi:AraC-like DNA-binding protein